LVFGPKRRESYLNLSVCGLQLFAHEKILVKPQRNPCRPLVQLKLHPALWLRGPALLEQSAVHCETRQLPGEFKNVVVRAALVPDKSFDVQVDGNVLGWEDGNVDGRGRLFWVDDVALSLKDAFGKDEHAANNGLVGRGKAHFNVSRLPICAEVDSQRGRELRLRWDHAHRLHRC
jgi:hypothetical protein